MKDMVKKIILILLVVLVLIQFFRPEKNVSAEVITARDISKVHPVPQNVQDLLLKKCYDCHSNNTHYPWYVNVQPVGWWLAHHVDEGKGELNFSEFSTYEKKKADHKLEEVGEVIEEGSMPLTSYTLLHPETKISADDRKILTDWLATLPIEKGREH
jgi:hypothetical protein